jgi:phage tail protein X
VRTAIDDSLALLPEPRVGERIPSSALPPEVQVLFNEAQMAMGSFGRTRLFLEQVITANPANAQFSPTVMESILLPDASTVPGHAVQQMLQLGAEPAAMTAAPSGGPQMLIIARDAMTGELYRLQAPLAGTEIFRPAPGDLLTLYWAGLSMQGPLRGLYLRHERSGDGILLADLGTLARSWQNRVKGLLQAGFLFLLILGGLVGLAVLAGLSSDLSETLAVAALILGVLGYLLFAGLR